MGFPTRPMFRFVPFYTIDRFSICVNRLCKFVKMTHSIDMCIIGYSVLWSIVRHRLCNDHACVDKRDPTKWLTHIWNEQYFMHEQKKLKRRRNGKKIDESKWFLFSHIFLGFFPSLMYWQNIITKSMKREFFSME